MRRRKKTVVVLALAGLAAGAAYVLQDQLRDDGTQTIAGGGERPFRVSYPDGWKADTAEKLRALRRPPLAVLRREDGKGVVVVRRRGAFEGNLSLFSDNLREALKERIPDFRELSARIGRVSSGNAYFYSYLRTKRGTLHTIVIVPAGPRSYVLNTVSGAKERQVAREIGEIVGSFAVSQV